MKVELEISADFKKIPTNEELRKVRKLLSLSTKKAASLVYVDPRTWYSWEGGERKISRSSWELFLYKTGLKVGKIYTVGSDI